MGDVVLFVEHERAVLLWPVRDSGCTHGSGKIDPFCADLPNHYKKMIMADDYTFFSKSNSLCGLESKSLFADRAGQLAVHILHLIITRPLASLLLCWIFA